MERNKKRISFNWGNKTKKNEMMTNQRGLRCFEYIGEPCFLRSEDVVGRWALQLEWKEQQNF